MNALLFLVLATLTVAGAVTVVVHPNPIHSALGLIVTLFLLSVFFVGLDAQLIAVLQVIVYAGAIVVLFLFVIMLLNLQVQARTLSAAPVVAAAGAGALALAVFLIVSVHRAPAGMAAPGVPGTFGDAATLAERLFTAYLLPFELTSLLLLVAVVGATAIAKRRP